MAGPRRHIIGFASHRIEALFDNAAPPARGTYVLCHPYPPYGGDMNNKVVVKAAAVLEERKFSVLRYNMRGVGASTGSMAVPLQDRDDLARLLGWLVKQGAPEPFYLAGYSYGGHVSVSLLSDPDSPEQAESLSAIRGIITIACPFNLPEFRMESLPHVPLEIIQGDKDDLVPVAEVEESLLEWDLAEGVHWIPGADHCFNGKLDAFQETFADCVERLANSAKEG